MNSEQNSMTRFWVSWWSGYYESEGCTEPPFQVWISGARLRSEDAEDTEKDDVSICAVIDAENEEQIWEVVGKHFPDYESRFCNHKESDWQPGDRFPDFQNQTQLRSKK